jgi:hypothetical protein
MDQQRFDRFSRSLAVRSSRRQAMRQAGAGGLIGGLGAMLGMRVTGAQGDTQTCALSINAEVYVGPCLGTVYEGTQSLDIDAEGAIDSGSFTTLDGQRYPLVGEADGRALDLRIDLGNDQLLTLTGTAEQAFAICQGAAAGSFSGPEMGNMGTWITTGPMTPSGSGGPGITPTETPGAGACAAVSCLVPMTPNPETCVCECPEVNPACGDVCCAAGAECVDPSTGTCLCPDGTELCGEVCVPSCEDGENLDDACTCVAACAGVDCELGETLNLETCECEAGILCAAGTVACGDVCADLDSDAENCGSCGHECPWMPTADDLLLPSLCVAGDCCLDDNMLCAADGDCCSGSCDFISGGLRVCT